MGRVARSRPRAVVAAVVLVVLAGCGSGQRSDDDAASTVVVPNDIIGDLVERVACSGGVVTVVEPDPAIEPVMEVTLDARPPEAASAPGAPLTISVAETVRMLDVGSGNDTWVWLDPSRMTELSQAVGGGLVASDAVTPEVVDRCLARFEEEMVALDGELVALADSLPPEQRILGIEEPGTVYFADRFGFTVDGSKAAAAAGRVMSVDQLGDHASYEALMRANTTEAIGVLAASS